MRSKIIMLVSLFTLLLLAGSALAADGYEIVRYVVGGGGGHTENSSYALNGTIGQAVVGQVANSPYELCSGYWCRGEGYKVYLPLVLRTY